MLNWDAPHPVHGRGDTCQACGCGVYSDVHEPSYPGFGELSEDPPESRTWYCTTCIYQERLRPAVVAFTRPTTDLYFFEVATFYCLEHLEGDAYPWSFPPQTFLINIALHVSRDGDDPDFTLLDGLLAGYEQVA